MEQQSAKSSQNSGGSNLPPKQTENVQLDYQPGIISKNYQGKSFVHGIIEVVKNGLVDWGGTQLLIDTLNKNWITFADDGVGVPISRWPELLSMNNKKEIRARQTGKYDTGTKELFFSFSKEMRAKSVAQEDPNTVRSASINPQTYERMLLTKSLVELFKEVRNEQNWPYPFVSGLELTYVFQDPSSRAIKRGKALAEYLSARLISKFQNMILVDKQPLPPKQINGEIFSHSMPHAGMGEVFIELYVPKNTHSVETLWFASEEVGEIPIKEFIDHLSGLEDRLPDVYRYPQIAGLISTPWIKDYINIDRGTLSAKIANDERLIMLLTLLRSLAPSIEKRLRLNMNSAASITGDPYQLIRSFAEKCNSRYSLDRKDVPGRSKDGEGGIVNLGENDNPDKPKEAKAFKLSVNKEYEIGEEIEVGLSFAPNTPYNISEVKWQTDASLAKNLKVTNGGLKLKANKVGHGRIMAHIPGTPHYQTCSYEIVNKRLPKLSGYSAVRPVGSHLLITVLNSDKLSGDSSVSWELSPGSVGLLEPQGLRAIYHAISVGSAKIIVTDLGNKKQFPPCEVEVFAEPEELLKIRDHTFRIEKTVAENFRSEDRAVIMSGRPESEVFSCFFNTQAPSYKVAENSGAFDQVFTPILASSYAGFVKIDLNPELADGISASEAALIGQQIQQLTGQIIYELNSPNEKKEEKKSKKS